MRGFRQAKERKRLLFNTNLDASNTPGEGKRRGLRLADPYNPQVAGSVLDATGRQSPSWTAPVTTDMSSWSTQDIGYFTPDDTSDEHTRTENSTTYYNNVFAFVNHIRSLAFYKPEPVIRANLHFCLLEKARDWFDMELTVMEKEDLREIPLETGWIRALLKRFTPLYDVALGRFNDGQYKKEDAENGYDPVKWAHSMMRNAQAAGITSTYAQLRQVWYSIDLELQWPVNCPTKSTLVSEFMKELDDAYLEWCDGESE
jgi:hypothetical protein